jgi:hypothetical protein
VVTCRPRLSVARHWFEPFSAYSELDWSAFQSRSNCVLVRLTDLRAKVYNHPGPIPSVEGFRIVRSVLVAMAILPMFMPPGMCLCQLAPTARPTPDPTISTTARAVRPIAAHPTACCEACAQHFDADPEESEDQDSDSTPIAHAAGPQKPGKSSPCKLPDCPVVTGRSLWTAVLANSLGAEWFHAAELSVEVAGLEPVGSPCPDSFPSLAQSVPLFISNCTLLI